MERINPNGFAFNTRIQIVMCLLVVMKIHTHCSIALHDNGKITTTGHVGIGTTSPTKAILELNGGVSKDWTRLVHGTLPVGNTSATVSIKSIRYYFSFSIFD